MRFGDTEYNGYIMTAIYDEYNEIQDCRICKE